MYLVCLLSRLTIIVGPAVGSGLYQLGGFTLPFLTVGIWCTVATLGLLIILPNVNKNKESTIRNENEIDFNALIKVIDKRMPFCLFEPATFAIHRIQ